MKLIAAVDKNWGIGRNNRLLVNIPEDMQLFRQETNGKVAKIVAAGGDFNKIRFTFQEYFRRMTEDPSHWSQPFAALLGAYEAWIWTSINRR